MNGSGITYEDVIAANVRNQKDKEIENLKQEVERLKNINEEHRILNGKLRKELQQKENIIKEVREYIETLNEYGIGKNAKKELLEILDKGE